jgi:hypothetical protein
MLTVNDTRYPDLAEVLAFIATHDEVNGQQWSDIRGPVITIALNVRFGSMVGLALHRLEALGLVEQVDRSLLRSNVPSWPSPQSWCQPWRLSEKGREPANWPNVRVH